jgi:hypothetical protein
MNNLTFTKILAIVGFLVGLFAAFNSGITYPTELLGFSIPYTVFFIFIGLVIDGIQTLVTRKKNK